MSKAGTEKRVRVRMEHETAARLAKIMLNAVDDGENDSDVDSSMPRNESLSERVQFEAPRHEKRKVKGRWIWQKIDEDARSVTEGNQVNQRSPSVKFGVEEKFESHNNSRRNHEESQGKGISTTLKSSNYPYDSAVYVRSLMERSSILPGEEMAMRDVCEEDDGGMVETVQGNFTGRGLTSAEKRLAKASLGPVSMMKYIIIPLAILFAGLLLFCKDGRFSMSTNFDVYDLCK
ncbi:hypothetical protein GUITHDRAFT_106584 [Guillardia theta CCMP2712]|uniref:Uncharacterized protein n=1 Tax=Guillardia theta (strain CCMP2712) TaxID=905079 RepID=L1JGY5_GUITC|nr:hypothetical protein GUITHDRAFT_106584 [Guillardia theta CCMP2712]EKX47597.1 hypothetical protein GUITHDRAFT_106584 [Guillardia theta CCMP2712]|eukprot:XP_005834577.1 hypothetical protein GUITHDRAFT_106584 [Guillardia theta CCMP2712]